jgi:hypothetical protein
MMTETLHCRGNTTHLLRPNILQTACTSEAKLTFLVAIFGMAGGFLESSANTAVFVSKRCASHVRIG